MAKIRTALVGVTLALALGGPSLAQNGTPTASPFGSQSGDCGADNVVDNLACLPDILNAQQSQPVVIPRPSGSFGSTLWRCAGSDVWGGSEDTGTATCTNAHLGKRCEQIGLAALNPAPSGNWNVPMSIPSGAQEWHIDFLICASTVSEQT